MQKHLNIVSVLVVGLFSALILSACTSTPPAQPITGTARDAVIAYADPQTDNLLQGYNSGDYAVFARDFADVMKQAETETVFTQTRTQLMSKLGAYVSREISDVSRQDRFIVVLYSAKFEQADGVTVRVVFEPDGTHPISGLWFNSPKLN